MARQKHDENHNFRITFEDGSEVAWGFHPLDLRGDHMALIFAWEREQREAALGKREPRKIKDVKSLPGYPREGRAPVHPCIRAPACRRSKGVCAVVYDARSGILATA